ncbi:hypothetical protein FACS1894179_09120 [Bacteroidia bacterium]|nr:hypothetical protein FACS1894169_08230 [Bacteroidia bacterium]GHV41287.1 hypothetical protein FACS1894179_09120 [Bacteroidia bacterium]
MKQTLILTLSLLLVFPVYSQSGIKEYRKFHLSINAGWDFVQGTSNTTFSDDFTLPLTKKGFTPGIDAAYFFTKNYGIGVKYRFYKASRESSSIFEYTEQKFEKPVYQYNNNSFEETNHMVGPAFFARWSLGDSRWLVSTNAGVVYVHNQISKIQRKEYYNFIDIDGFISYPPDFPQDKRMGYSDLSGNTIGLTLSAGIRYQIFPFLGAGISANGLFASISKMEQADVSRKINRIGVSAAIDFSF